MTYLLKPSLYFTKITLILGLISFFGMGCDNKEVTHAHRLLPHDGSTLYYLQKQDTLLKHAMDGEITLKEMKDSLSILVSHNGKNYLFQGIPPEYANQNCTVEFSKNELKDYFPPEWVVLKDADNYATIRLFIDNGFFHLIVINSLNGTEIGRHAEKY